MKRSEALALAGIFMADFGRHFARLEVAGSVRRGVEEVKDLELVGIITPENKQALAHALDTDNRFVGLKPGTPDRVPWPIKKDGKYWKLAFGDGVRFGPVDGERKIDLFMAEPDNFGWIYLIRTGP